MRFEFVVRNELTQSFVSWPDRTNETYILAPTIFIMQQGNQCATTKVGAHLIEQRSV